MDAVFEGIDLAESPRAADFAGATLSSDSELVAKARQGDRRAFGTLYLRHHDAAWRVACAASGGSADAEDAVAEGFTKVFAALPRIVDRELAFRPYLLACVRNAAMDLHRRGRKIDLRDEVPDHDPAPGDDEPHDVIIADLERNLVGEALKSLPERWRTVLWLTEVEGMTPTEVSAVIGIKPNAVAALSYRAREGLREAYLQAHLRAEAPGECRYTVDRLGPYVRRELADRELVRVQTHLDSCSHCRRRRDELADVNASLLGSLRPAPLVLGSRAQQEWLAASGNKGKGARRTRTPARAAVVANRDVEAITQRAMVMVLALLLLIGGGISIDRFRSDERSGSLDRVALPRGPLAAGPASTPPPAGPDEVASPPAPPAREGRSARPPAKVSAPKPSPTVAMPAPGLPPDPASAPAPGVQPTTPTPDRASAPPSSPDSPPEAPPTAPAPPPAAAARASVGRGSTGVVVGAGIPDDGSPPETDFTAGNNQVAGDEPPSDGSGVEGGGSAVPPAASEGVGEASEAVGAVDGAVPAETPAGETPPVAGPEAGDPASQVPSADVPPAPEGSAPPADPGSQPPVSAPPTQTDLPAGTAPAPTNPPAATNPPTTSTPPVQAQPDVQPGDGQAHAAEDMWGPNSGQPTASPS